MTENKMQEQEFKRHIAYKLRIGEIATGKPTFEGDRFKTLELNGRDVTRVNLIGNVTDKFVQEGEKKFASVTLDDASGQIKAKLFGEDIAKFANISQGDTVIVIGLIRSWNNELYVTPEIIKKKNPAYLLVRKHECDIAKPKNLDKQETLQLREQLLKAVKDSEGSGGVDIEQMMLALKTSPDAINMEIRKLLEEGLIYEPRPGKLRYLG